MSFRNLFPEDFSDFIFKSPEKLSVLFARLLISAMWISHGIQKVMEPPSYFYNQIKSMVDTNPEPIVKNLIDSIVLQNWEIFLWIIVLSELFIGFTILLGFFSRIGSFVGMGMTIVLWTSTWGWGEWLFTYPLIFLPNLMVFWSTTSKDLGIDSLIYPFFENTPLKYMI